MYFWHQNIWQNLKQAWQKKRWPPVLLLHGPEGLGKMEFAHRLAQALLCSSDQLTACQQCSDCRWFQSGHHPHYHPIEKDIKIESIRDLIDKDQIRSGPQIYLIAPAESMHPAAANALLKLLEEPNPDHYLILVSHQLNLLPTLLSRCQLIRFSPPSFQSGLDWLKQEYSASEAQHALFFAQNAPLKARDLIRSGQIKIWRMIWQDLFQMHSISEYVQKWLQKTDQNTILYLMRLALLSWAWQNAGIEQNLQLPVKRLDWQKAQQLSARIESAAQYPINAHLILEYLLFYWLDLME